MTATRPPKKRRPYRRTEILSAAAQLFDQKGYHATGIDEIGSVAGLTGPAIYSHFRSKEDLLETLLLECMASYVERATQIVADAPDPRTAIDALIEGYVDSLFDNPAMAAVAAYERRNLRPEVAAEVSRSERGNFDAWVKVLSELQPDRSLADLRAMVQGTSAMAVAMVSTRRRPRRDRTALVVGMVRRALDVED